MMRPPKWWALFLCLGRSDPPLGGCKSLHPFQVGNGPGLCVNFRISFDPNCPNQKSFEIFTENTPSKRLVFLRITKGQSLVRCIRKNIFPNPPLKTGLKSGYSEEGHNRPQKSFAEISLTHYTKRPFFLRTAKGGSIAPRESPSNHQKEVMN